MFFGRRLAFQSDDESIRLLLLSKYSQSEDSELEDDDEDKMALFRLEQRLRDAALFLNRRRGCLRCEPEDTEQGLLQLFLPAGR